jgi:hypothetical protein
MHANKALFLGEVWKKFNILIRLQLHKTNGDNPRMKKNS